MIDFLSMAQRAYVEQYCAEISRAIALAQDSETTIDMDAVADAAGKSVPKPKFFYAEQSQQNRFKCRACGGLNDILGIYGYCSICATRNDLQELAEKAIPSIRERINNESSYETCVRDAVAVFDSLAGRIAEQLTRHVPMIPERKNRMQNRRFHNLKSCATDFKDIFGIDVLRGMDPDAVDFSNLMFHRRHVYEHRGGEADEKYIAESGDLSVRPRQALHETKESAHRIVGLILKMAENLHDGFHAIFPPYKTPIERNLRNAGGRKPTT